MGVKYGDFQYPESFGFTGSAKGRHDPQSHPNRDDGNFGDKLAKGGQPKAKKFDDGGMMPQQPARPAKPPMPNRGAARKPNIPIPGETIPVSTALNAARGALALGQYQGAKHVATRLLPQHPAIQGVNAQAAAQRGAQAPAIPAPAVAAPGPAAVAPGLGGALTQGAPQGLAEGGHFIQKGIRHPGRMKKLAARHGVSLGQEIAKDKHSDDPSLRAAANLGARFRSGDLSKKGR